MLHLDPDESRHAVKALRMNPGDAIEVTDGNGVLYRASILEANYKKCSFTIQEKIETPARRFSISIGIAPTKNIDRTEWFIEKAVEIGIENIHLLICKNSERKSVNFDRLVKIMISAMKQSGQTRLPQISDLVPFREITSLSANQKFICFVDATNPDSLKSLVKVSQHYLILIGPEGDFSQEEIKLALEYDFKKVNLGPNRLRTETAALTACQALNFINL